MKPMTLDQVKKEFDPPETGGVCCCKHCRNWYEDDFDALYEHLENCKEYRL